MRNYKRVFVDEEAQRGLRWRGGACIMKEEVTGMEALMSKREVARALNISIRGVDRLAERGKLRRVKIGRLTKFEPADVRALVEKAKEEGK